MKILHVYKSYYPDTVGGIEQVIAQLGTALAAVGDESRVFTLSPDPDPPVLAWGDVEVHRCRTTVEISSNPLSVPALREFRRQVEWADVVHYQFPWPFADLMHMTGVRKPSVVSYQSDIVRQKVLMHVYAPLMYRFLRKVDAVVATSPQYRESSPVLARLGREVRVIPNGIDSASYPAPQPDRVRAWREIVGEGFFLFVGVLRYYKGLEILLRAAQGFEGRVVIAGTGPEAGHLLEFAKRERLDNVQFVGAVSEADKIALLELSRAFVFPSHLRSEAFGMSLLEASMCARPMVCCEIGTGTSYINADGETGFVVPPADSVALRDAMRRFVGDPALAENLGQAARSRYLAKFPAQEKARSYDALYRELATASR